MSFGYYDRQWVDPDDVVYTGGCWECTEFHECPCGCGWGYCSQMPGEFYDGQHETCEYGVPK